MVLCCEDNFGSVVVVIVVVEIKVEEVLMVLGGDDNVGSVVGLLVEIEGEPEDIVVTMVLDSEDNGIIVVVEIEVKEVLIAVAKPEVKEFEYIVTRTFNESWCFSNKEISSFMQVLLSTSDSVITEDSSTIFL